MTTTKEILESDTCSMVIEKQVSGGLIFSVVGEELKAVALRMAKMHISALPVFSNQDDRSSCLGLLDFGDIVSFILHASSSHKGLLGDSDKFWQFLAHTRVEEVVNHSGQNLAHEISIHAPLKLACEIFSMGNSVKRLLVTDKGRVVGLLSPSALSSHCLARLKGRMDPHLLRTAASLHLMTLDADATTTLLTCPRSCILLDAMMVMKKSNQGCIAVVDAHALCGSISMSDVKLLFAQEDLSILKMPVWDFIVLSRSLRDEEQFPYFGVGPDSVLLSVVSKLLATSVHNVYVVDKRQSPIKVLGFADVCKGLLMA